MGIPMAMIEAKKREILRRETDKNNIGQISKKLDEKVSQVNGMLLMIIVLRHQPTVLLWWLLKVAFSLIYIIQKFARKREFVSIM